jgi:hypothetical protein
MWFPLIAIHIDLPCKISLDEPIATFSLFYTLKEWMVTPIDGPNGGLELKVYQKFLVRTCLFILWGGQ